MVQWFLLLGENVGMTLSELGLDLGLEIVLELVLDSNFGLYAIIT